MGDDGAMSMDQELLELLACPACHAAVRDEGEALVCQGCARSYPVREIPILLVEESSGGD
jgi:uncharacterized protein YbaR (Trm112 family)